MTEEHEKPSYWLLSSAVVLLPLLVVLHQRLHMLAYDDSYIHLRVVLPPNLPAYRDTMLARGWDTRRNLDLWLRRDAPCDIHAIEASAHAAFQ